MSDIVGLYVTDYPAWERAYGTKLKKSAASLLPWRVALMSAESRYANAQARRLVWQSRRAWKYVRLIIIGKLSNCIMDRQTKRLFAGELKSAALQCHRV
jgi:hypothetical protein